MRDRADGAAGFFLRTERLLFRLWREEDLDLALGLWGDPAVTRWIDARLRLSRQQVRERLLQEIHAVESAGVQYWPVFERSSREHVGCCGLRPYDPRQGVYELGVHIRSRRWRCGYAMEAARAVIKYAFDERDTRALFAGHHPDNEASRSLLEKLGFRHTHDELYRPTGLDHPSYLLMNPRA